MVQALREAEGPSNAKKVRSFLGMTIQQDSSRISQRQLPHLESWPEVKWNGAGKRERAGGIDENQEFIPRQGRIGLQ